MYEDDRIESTERGYQKRNDGMREREKIKKAPKQKADRRDGETQVKTEMCCVIPHKDRETAPEKNKTQIQS